MKKGIVILFVAVLAACGQNKPKDEKLIRGGNRNGAAGAAGKSVGLSATNTNAVGIWGVVTVGGSAQWGVQSSNPNDISRFFLSTNWIPDSVGQTSTVAADPNFRPTLFKVKNCVPGQNCAVLGTFGVESGDAHQPLQLQGNMTYNQLIGSGQKVNITGGGITLAFFDSLTGDAVKADTGETVTNTAIPVYVDIDTTNSYVQGKNISMNFRDDYGVISVYGSVDYNGIYNGDITFINSQSVNDGGQSKAAAAGSLGKIQIYACSFLRCQ